MSVVTGVFLLLVACGDDKGVDTLGTVVAGDQSADLRAGAAFGVNVNGRASVLVSGNPDLTCAEAAAYLRSGSSDDNPEVVVPGGTCALYLDVMSGYEAAGVSIADDATAATFSLSCAMGEGAWVREERGEGDLDWYWSGAYWQGGPTSFDLALSGGDESPFALDLTMDAYNGSFPYDTTSPDPDPATGAVTVTALDVAWCPEIASAVAR